tara:strand:- start:220 stop:387 length:168 start_codon:yes stop_codon:yes gene_type:complete
MKKIILAINLLIKTIMEFIFVCTIGAAIGIIVFICAYLYKSIQLGVEYFNNNKNE